MGFGLRVKTVLEEKGLKQSDLCTMAGIKSGLLSQYMTNPDRDPKLSTACKIAVALDVSIDYLGGLIDEPRPIDRDEEGNIVLPESLLQRQLRDGFLRLNDDGQKKAVDYVQDLTEVERYTEQAKKETGDGVGA